MKTLFATLATVLVLASPARADGLLDQILTPFDKARLANFDQSSAAALREARAGGDPADVAVLDKALAGQAMPIGNPLGA